MVVLQHMQGGLCPYNENAGQAMYFSFQTQARPIVLEDPELMAMRYHLLASFLFCQYSTKFKRVSERTYLS
jgi:hypothetical protein